MAYVIVAPYLADSEIAKLNIDELWMYKLAEVYPKASKADYATYKEAYYAARRRDIKKKLEIIKRMYEIMLDECVFDAYSHDYDLYMANVDMAHFIRVIEDGYDNPTEWYKKFIQKHLGLDSNVLLQYTKDKLLDYAVTLLSRHFKMLDDVFLYDNGVYFGDHQLGDWNMRCFFKPNSKRDYITFRDIYNFCEYHKRRGDGLYFESLSIYKEGIWEDDGYITLGLSLRIG